MTRQTPLILVTDDEAHIVHVVSMKLRNAGFEVITAEDGEEGFDATVERLPDLVITDYHMPFMTGLEMCAKLKKDGRTASIPALMLTARGFDLGGDYLRTTNIVGVLSKPFSPREVLARVQEILAGAVAEACGDS